MDVDVPISRFIFFLNETWILLRSERDTYRIVNSKSRLCAWFKRRVKLGISAFILEHLPIEAFIS